MGSEPVAVTQAPAGFGDWVLQACPDGLWVLDAEGTTTFANDRAAGLLGVPAKQLTGVGLRDVLDEASSKAFEQHVAKLDRSRPTARPTADPSPPPEAAWSLRRAVGSVVQVHVASSALLDEAGAFRGWLHRLREHGDPDLGVEGNEELERREQQLSEAQEIAGIGNWDWDLPSDRLTWSEGLYRVYGFDPATFEPSYDAFLRCLHPDDHDRVASGMQDAIVAGGPFELDHRICDDNGEVRWLRGRGIALCDESGRVVRLAGSAQDITEIKETEIGLALLNAMASAANEARTLHQLLAAAGETVRPYAKWPVVLVSVPAESESAELLHIDVDWEESTPLKQEAARRVAQQAADERRTVERPGPDGDILVGGPVYAEGRLASVLVTDTGTPREPSAANRGVFAQVLVLLSHVAEREWAARELKATRDQALSASRAKSDFLATMSHEIRTPLNGVIGLSELLGSTELTPHQRRLAAGVDQAGRTLLALVNDILDLSKIEAGKLDLEEVDFDPRLVIEQSAALVADRAREKGLELVVSSATDVPDLARGDPVRFGQVVTNLAANAVKFTSAGEVHVRATATPSREGCTLHVEVIDTGVGIAPENQDKLFEAFTQADSSTTREYGGTGLGLAICKRIVSAMNGDIGLRSELGVGSTFWFTVALGSPLEDAPGREEARGRRLVAGLRVLVVDDNETNRYILTEKLDGWQIEAQAVESAYEALVELDAASRRGAAYDIVLLDHMMPGADGEQLARLIRAESRHDRTRLALLSSGLEPADQFLDDAGIDIFLRKPVLAAQLLDTLATLGGRCHSEAVRSDQVAPPVQDGTRGRVLVVEDNPVNQLVAEGVLQRLGYTVVMAEDGAVGLKTFIDDPEGFDAVLMDCQMPVLDGYDATRAIRTRGAAGSRVPIIAMTAAAAVAEERERCRAAGMDDFLPKPVDVALLERTLDRFVPVPEESREPADAVGREMVPERPAPAPAPRRGTASEQPEVLDRSRLAELMKDGAADLTLVLRILNRFGSRAGDTAVDLSAAVHAGSPTEVSRLAHLLRGSASNVGLVRLAVLCTDVELVASAGQLPAQELLTDLQDEVAAGVRALQEFARHLIREAAASADVAR